MNKVARTGIISFTTVGLIAGSLFGRYIADKLLNKDRRINKGIDYTNAYIAQCDTLKLKYKELKDSLTYFKVRGVGGAAYIDLDKYWFYSPERKKYFEVMNFSNGHNEDYTFAIYMMDDVRDTLVVTVNRQELNDPTYGTLQKPVPVLYERSTRSGYPTLYSIIKEKTDEWKGDETKYHTYKLAYNVNHYLSYIKSKADFNRMFGLKDEKK